MSYTRQKTWEAVSCLVGMRPLRERLADAGVSLVILRSPSDALEDSFSRKLDYVIDRLTQDGRKDLERGCADLTDEQAQRVAKDILALFVDAFGGL